MAGEQAATCASSCTAIHGLANAAAGGARSTTPDAAGACARSAFVAHGGTFSASRGQKPSDRPAAKVPAGACASTE